MELTLKQRYLQANSPIAVDFQEERTRNFDKLIVLISATDRTRWLSTGFNCGSLIQSYKQVYGLTSQQFQTLISLLANIGLKQEGLSTETRVLILKLANSLTDYQIRITDNFKISNSKLLQLLNRLAKQGMDGTLRNADAVIEELSKFILYFSRFGEEVIEEGLQLSVEYSDIRYLVIFIKSLQTQGAALRLLVQLFADNNLWDRDCFWFYILSEITKKFPRIDYSPYYQTIMQEVIRAFTTIIQGSNEESLKQLTITDPFLQIQPVLKSVAFIMVYLLLPNNQPQHVFIKSCVERLFSLVTSSLDHINPPEYLGDMLGFVKIFVSAYLQRYRNERGTYLLMNEDSIQDFSKPPVQQLLIDTSCQQFFDSLWQDIIPKIVYLEDGDQCKPSKIISELCNYKPDRFLTLSLQSILSVLSRDDPTIISLHGAKMAMLFLQDFVAIDQPEYLSIYIECCSKLLNVLQKLGVSSNLDIIELVFRTFLYLDDKQIDLTQIQSLVEDSISLILDNLEPMSIGLEGSTDGDQADLYIDFGNVFFPFLIRLDPKQLELFSEKFLYRLTHQIPEHGQAYEMITIALSYMNPKFARRVFKHILKQLIIEQEDVKAQGEEQVKKQWEFLKAVGGSLQFTNEQALGWYTTLIQAVFQYHPQNIIDCWPDIEQVLNLLFSQWDGQAKLEMGLDILYNLLLCLCKPHLPWQELFKSTNGDYKTLKLTWQPLLPQAKAIIDEIYDKYFFDIEHYLKRQYNDELINNQNNVTVLGDFQTYIEKTQNQDTIRIRRRNLKLVDFILMPKAVQTKDIDDRKLIYSALSIQYTVLSALMLRVPFHSDLDNIGGFFTEERYCNLRPKSCEYLEWVLQLLGHFDLMAEESFIKLFNFFWRESHDEVAYTATIAATNQKIVPYYFPQMHRKKELLRSPFLLVNEAYLCHMVRLEFYLIVAPTAHLNNPRYLESNFILGLSPSYQPNLHSYFPSYVEVHKYHRQLMAICRYHLDPNNQEGYLWRLHKEEDAGVKERLLMAIKGLIMGIKRLLNVYSDNCCMKDQFIRNTIFELIAVYRLLPKKSDKALVYEIFYVLLVFSFDPLCLSEAPEYSIRRYWSLRVQNSPEAADYEIITVGETPNVNRILQVVQKEEIQFLENLTSIRNLKLTRSCSYKQDNENDLPKQLERAVVFLIRKIEEGLPTLQKDLGVYLLMLLLYSNQLDLTNPLISDLIKLLFKLCQTSYTELFDMSKTGFFHIINRFNYNQKKQKVFANTPVQRSWSDFLRFKQLGAKDINYQKIKCQKTDNNYYPNREIKEYSYAQLALDSQSPTFANQSTLLSVLQDEEGLKKFIHNCSMDPDLKQNDQNVPSSIVVSEDDFKSISSSAHKLMHFIWDCNPSDTPLFMGVIERYSASPLNFYNRFFRKSIRITGDKTKKAYLNLAKHFRTTETEQLCLSFYINCELMLEDPNSFIHLPFLNYMEECSKENFQFLLMGLYGIFTANFVVAEKIYQLVLARLRNIKGPARLRHLLLLNTYMIAQGRFARAAAEQGASHLLKGISEGTDQISETVVNMITECFVQVVNMKTLNQWVAEPMLDLVQQKKIHVLNEYVGYNNEDLLIVLLTELMKKAREEQSIQSSKLRIYSQIVRKIVASITIYRFNSYFYNMLKQLVLFVIQQPAPTQEEQATADLYVVSQLCDSEYPEEIYKDILKQILPMADRTPYVVKKKLMFLEGIVIHRSFRLNIVQIPPLLSMNQKIITLDFIFTISNIARLMKNEELTAEAQRLLSISKRKKHDTYLLISLLMATGVREFEWKEAILRDLIKHKKEKLVKESISEWWKGKSPQSAQELRIAELVRNFENPYSYFA